MVGGTGFFGRAALDLLRETGIPALAAARRSAELTLDAEDAASIRRALRAGDVVLDAAGPFQARTTLLARSATEIGFDLVDLADALGYVQQVRLLDGEAAAAGVRLMPACSTASAVSAAALAWSGLPDPVRFTALLAPATGRTAVSATAASLLASVGRPIRVMRGSALIQARGFAERREWPAGTLLGRRRGWLFETADAATLPIAHPGLHTVEWFVDPNVRVVGPLLAAAARISPLRGLIGMGMPAALPLVRLLGGSTGGFGCEIEDRGGRIVRVAIASAPDAYRLAVVPAALAVRALAEGGPVAAGVLPPHHQVDAGLLRTVLERMGFAIEVIGRSSDRATPADPFNRTTPSGEDR